ncbi:MAG: methyltransferase domain-containing protein [Alphaproteobacteria bacterium]|nr:methyltransferase domain-containing protein [Alphaproteobacteria bacterium]
MSDVAFRRPSLARYRAFLLWGGLSVLRLLLYERMTHVALNGTVLDFGGGAQVNYAGLIPCWTAAGQTVEYWSANIDPVVQPTFQLRIGQLLPINDASFDAVLSLSTLEHVYELDDTLAELGRVLKSGGRLVLAIPFMFRVHGHPDDYHRGTPSFWRRKLGESGFEDVVVEALAWGPFSTGHVVSGLPGPFKSIRRHTGLLLDILWGACRYRGSTTVVGRQDDPFLAAPLGYFIEARKASAMASATV